MKLTTILAVIKTGTGLFGRQLIDVLRKIRLVQRSAWIGSVRRLNETNVQFASNIKALGETPFRG